MVAINNFMNLCIEKQVLITTYIDSIKYIN